MFDPRLKTGMVAFLTLSGLFGGNLFFMQSAHRESSPNRVAFPRSAAAIVVKPPIFSAAPVAVANAEVDRPVPLTPAPKVAAAAVVAASWTPTDTGSLSPVTPDTDLTRAIQRELQVLGYDSGGVDGVSGVTTRAAIMAFEWDHGFALSGEPKQDILQSLLMGGKQGGAAGAAASLPAGPQAKEVIKTVQQNLTTLGLSKVKPSGLLDEGTRGAIRRFEAREGMQQTGRISGRMTARLLRLAAEKRIAPEKRVAKS
jgi:peptidoglycan hydrolase-like protein with peptidoglycan-binding domain